MRIFPKPLAFAVVVALAVPVAMPVWAQTAPKKNSYITADDLRRTPTGGVAKNLVIRDPQLDFDADSASYDGKELQNVAAIREIRARGNVKIRLAPKPKSSADKPFQIQSKADEATLTFGTSTLILQGNVSGFYRVGDGPQTVLKGEYAKFNYAPSGLNALVKGAVGKQVELLLPAETDKPNPLGPINVRSDELRVDQANNAAYFSGNARAFSDSGDNTLDVAAPSFTLTSAGNGAIGTLVTNGKTVTKIKFAPDANAPATANALSYVEVTADKATVNRATSTGAFEGNVVGFYQLQNSSQKFDIRGEQVTVKYDEQAAKNGDGLTIDATGLPVYIEIPELSLNF